MLTSNIANKEANTFNDLFKKNRHAWIRSETELVSEGRKVTGFLGKGMMAKFELVPGFT